MASEGFTNEIFLAFCQEFLNMGLKRQGIRKKGMGESKEVAEVLDAVKLKAMQVILISAVDAALPDGYVKNKAIVDIFMMEKIEDADKILRYIGGIKL